MNRVILMSMLTLGLAHASSAQDRAGAADGVQTATFAGGCFWCMEPPYDKLDGVLETISGYAGGHVVNPSYAEVSSGTTGHAEVVRVHYDPERVSYERLLEVYWRNIDPLDSGGQFCDRGSQYRSAIFAENSRQLELARQSRQRLENSANLSAEIVTEVTELEAFYPAEDYHQNYYQEHPVRYEFYRFTCGRDDRLDELWGS